jgi:hypothetical protein
MANTDITGTVFDKDLSPQPNATVALMLADVDSEVTYTTTDPNGNYQFSSHPQATESTQEWHVVGYYEDSNGKYNGFSEPYISAQLIPPAIEASGGDNVFTETLNGTEYKIHEFTTDGTFTVSTAPPGKSIDVLIVGGGGGGGGGDSGDGSGGGGGAGGLIFKENESVSETSYSINIGSGGAGGRYNGSNGQDTTAFGYTALGGGYGGDGDATNNGGDGGSGGGGGGNSGSNNGGAGLQPTSTDGGFGNPGGGATTASGDEGGGGGGAGEAGFNGRSYTDVPPSGPGGDGLDYSDKFGTSVGENGYFAGGGAGHADDRGGGLIPGGLGGGGDFNDNTREQFPGQDGTGGGGAGGGKGGPRLEGEDGGDGVVLIRYEL